MPSRNSEAADHGGAQGRDREQREIEHRGRRAPRMPDIGVGRDRAAGDQRPTTIGRQEVEPEHRAAEGEPGDAEAREHGAERIERLGRLGRDVSM